MPAIINYRPQELEGWIKEGRLGMEEEKREREFSFFLFYFKIVHSRYLEIFAQLFSGYEDDDNNNNN